MMQEIAACRNERGRCIGIIGIVNGVGRLPVGCFGLSWPKQHIHSIFPYPGSGFLSVNADDDPVWFPVCFYVIISAMAAALPRCRPFCQMFSDKELAAIHGRILSAWAMAGIAGIDDITGEETTAAMST
jgi:OFA family oxalate/formate antiporter-like MFS transporter